MTKTILLIRHCQATGQAADAPLTALGNKQAQQLCDALRNYHSIDRIISSPSTRAVQSIRPLAVEARLDIETDERLKERLLSTSYLPDWMEKLKASFVDADLSFAGGESGREAETRVMKVVNEIWGNDGRMTAIVTHGNLMTLLIKHFINDFGFEDWMGLTNPDVFALVNNGDKISVRRLWDVEN